MQSRQGVTVPNTRTTQMHGTAMPFQQITRTGQARLLSKMYCKRHKGQRCSVQATGGSPQNGEVKRGERVCGPVMLRSHKFTSAKCWKGADARLSHNPPIPEVIEIQIEHRNQAQDLTQCSASEQSTTPLEVGCHCTAGMARTPGHRKACWRRSVVPACLGPSPAALTEQPF